MYKLRHAAQFQDLYRGQVVTGVLKLGLQKAEDFDSIEVVLIGKEEVYAILYTEGFEDENVLSYSTPYQQTTCVDEKTIVWSSESSPDNILGAGTHSFPFQFILPQNCPPSYRKVCPTILGRICYYVQGHINNKEGRSCKKTNKTYMKVVQLMDINQPELQIAIHRTEQKTVGCLCCSSGEVEATIFLPCKGFCVGHNILLTIKIENNSSQSAVLTVTVMQAICLSNRHYNFRLFFATSPRIEAYSSYIWTPDSLTIPLLTATTFKSELISLSYYLSVTTAVRCAKKSSIKLPIVVGNIPPRYQNEPVYLNL